ncbi:MAG: tRNA (guanosine(37)-N1)-methyltransferase TrmD [Chlorobia bacterium]|nr:tRNA (guanosine(37)-N1)-methyltransferase TrmD [Fimbriimonadaceae bacterium]
MLRIDFLTLFPEMVLGACRHSILQRAEVEGKVAFDAVNPRDFTYDRHGKVDDMPYGGAAGMLISVEPVHLALQSIGIEPNPARPISVVMTDPTGKTFTQSDAQELATKDRVVFLCGHYEGFDDRVRQLFATHTFSIGDYVLTGGELPALVMADSIVRLLPGALGSEGSLHQDSHSDGLLSAPNFTRPDEYFGLAVPEVLKSGDHKKIAKWKREQSLKITKTNRPDLLRGAALDIADLDMLSS